MNRLAGAVIVAALLVLAWVGYDRPELFRGDVEAPRLVWLVMALLLVSGAGFGFWRFRQDGGRALAGILFWGALIVAITFVYPYLS